MRLIDGDALEKFLSDAEMKATKRKKYVFASALNVIQGNVRNFPTIEPELKKGKWIWQTENRYVCSECGHHTQVDELFEEPMYAFCPYCSTSMLDEDGNVRYGGNRNED